MKGDKMKKTSMLKVTYITALLLVTVMVFFGCAPKGFGQIPIEYNGSYFLHQQFPQLNIANSIGGPMGDLYFPYNGEIFTLKRESISGGTLWDWNCKFSVYSDVGKIGDFVLYEQVQYDAIFLDENYLYYGLREVKYKKYFDLPHGKISTAGYFKYLFYRFDLEKGQNENINVNQFYDKLHIYHSRAILK